MNPEVLRIFRIPYQQRKSKEIRILFEFINEFQFFKNYIDQNELQIVHLCCQYMFLEEFEKNKLIYQQNSIGNKMYIML